MDSDQGKLFIGGISWETTEEKLSEYFGQFGEVLQTVVVRDSATNRPRGFGFVVFSDPSILDAVLQNKHTIDGRTVEAKRALSREEQQISSRSGGRDGGTSYGGRGDLKTKKIFVGGLPPNLTEDGFRQYFESYGVVTDVVVMFDQTTQRPRGFGFITFDTEEAVDRVLHKSFHDLNGKTVEVKRALPKDGGGHSGGGGGYQGYDSSSSGNGSYEANRYMQPQAAVGGFTPYGAQAYGYGAVNNMVGYGGYSVGGYGMMGPGYGAAAGYGNPNVQNANYGSEQQPGSKGGWSAQPPSGYGSAAPYGGTAAGYGYYNGSDGSYGNQGNNNGNSDYSNTTWNAENGNGAAGGQAGSGYGAPQTQQAHQQ